MATLRQIEASRANGAKSQGPVTTEGKARTRLNGAKHGIYSKAIVLNNEDPEAYALTLSIALDEWAPANSTERRLVTDIVNAEWRIDRLTAYETAALDLETDRMRPEVDEAFETIDEATRATLAFNSLITNNGAWDRIQTALRTQYRIRDRALSLLRRLQAERRKTAATTEPVPASTTPEHHGPQTADPAPRQPTDPAANTQNRRTEPGPASRTTHPLHLNRTESNESGAPDVQLPRAS